MSHLALFRELNISVPSSTRNNGSLFLHLLLVSNSEKQTNFFSLHQKPDTVHTKIRLTQFHIPEASAFQLLGNVKKKVLFLKKRFQILALSSK